MYAHRNPSRAHPSRTPPSCPTTSRMHHPRTVYMYCRAYTHSMVSDNFYPQPGMADPHRKAMHVSYREQEESKVTCTSCLV
jgi:hypothetical protein